MMKSKLQKLDGLTHTELKNNISKVLEKILCIECALKKMWF